MTRVSQFVLAALLAFAIHTSGYQQPTAQAQATNANELPPSPTEEKDSYEIYSTLLKTEMGPEWHITAWAIRAETQTYPHLPTTGNDDSVCLEPSREQKSTYLPVIEDYIAKNRKKLRLERKFNLPQYAFVGPNGIYSGLPFSASVIFHVSAIGFNPDRTRALVYVGHDLRIPRDADQHFELMSITIPK